MAGSQVAWGIDIGATALKAIKVRKEGDGAVIDTFDVVEHDKFLTEPDVDRDSIVRTSLQKFLDRNTLKGETMLISVAGSKTFARFVKLPPVEPKKIPEIVKFEAIQQIPFPLEQVNWDYQTFANADSPEVEVGIFAMKKDLVAQEMANFTSLKMSIQGVQLAPLALYNASVYDGWTEGKGTVLVDIGAEHTDLVIVDAGRIWLRTINLGGNHFTDALAKAFKRSFTQAEALKKQAATSKYQKQIFQAMRPIFADLVAEISRSLGHYQTSHRDSHLERIIAMGNPFKLPNLQKYIQQELKMEVVRMENFKKATVDSKLAAGLQENILSLGVAYGLALQGLDRGTIDTNLLPTEIAREMIWRKKRPWFAGAAAAVLVSCGYWGYSTYAEKWEFDKNQAEHKETNNSARGAAERAQKEFMATNVTFSSSRSEVDRLVNLTEYRNYLPEIMEAIYRSVPQAKLSSAVVTADLAKGNYPARHQFIVIKSVEALYTTNLNENLAKPYEDDTASITSTGAKGAGPAPAKGGYGDRGFLITLNIYTPCGANPTAKDENAIALIEEFKTNIRNQALQSNAKGKKYYFTTTQYPLDMAGGTGAVGFTNLDWGWGGRAIAAGGLPYWSMFVPEQMNMPKAGAPAFPGAAPVGGNPFAPPPPGGGPAGAPALYPVFPVDAVIAGPGVDIAKTNMNGYTHVTFKVKAHFTEGK